MENRVINKRKIINDPVHGFITITFELVYDVIQHPYFQRLRRIKQLGLSHLVYPGANHTRFHHALGAMHLMTNAIAVLRSKGVEISEKEAEAVTLAILLHDIGHGPFSHTLENSITDALHHEDISLAFMEELNKEFDGRLTLAIDIFKDDYHRPFLNQLVSSQLDMDRLDYLQRDSYFTGVSEGVIGAERIITMLNVRDDKLVMDEKGIYSIENFIGSRRIMYWQVYMHKTVVSSEHMLINILNRAKYLFRNGADLFASPHLKFFLENDIDEQNFSRDESLNHFAMIDDADILSSIKVWTKHEDLILSTLCQYLIDRKLFKTTISNEPIDTNRIEELKEKIKVKIGIEEADLKYFIQHHKLVNSAYTENYQQINILQRNGQLKELAQASDNLNILALSKPVEKYCLCHVNIH